MCNLYNQTTAVEAMRHLFDGLKVADSAGNLAPGKVYPDQLAPIIRHGGDGLELARARWGMPNKEGRQSASGRDQPLTNIRHPSADHWQRWMSPEHRCLVPLDRFAEPIPGGNQWFAASDSDTIMFFAGIEVRGWRSIRKVKDGETTDDLFGFLTTSPNAEVKPVHPKAMPVILTTPDEWQAWLNLPWDQAKALQRPLADGALKLV